MSIIENGGATDPVALTLQKNVGDRFSVLTIVSNDEDGLYLIMPKALPKEYTMIHFHNMPDGHGTTYCLGDKESYAKELGLGHLGFGQLQDAVGGEIFDHIKRIIVGWRVSTPE